MKKIISIFWFTLVNIFIFLAQVALATPEAPI